MHSRVVPPILLTLALLLPTPAQADARQYISHTWSNGVLDLVVSDGRIRVNVLTDHALEAEFVSSGLPANPPSFALARDSRGNSKASLTDTNGTLQLTTAGLSVIIRKDPLEISYRYNGRNLIAEDPGYIESPDARGFRFRIGAGETFFGGGSRALGTMDRRGHNFPLYNASAYGYGETSHQMYYSMPAVVSSRKYMLVFDNAARGTLDIDSQGDGHLTFRAVGGRMAYLLIAGDDWLDLATRIADTTGYQPMLPRWALGHIASRMGYHSQNEVERVVETFIKQDFPIDAIVLDLFWFGNDIRGYMGNLDWDYRAFPKPIAMMDRLRDKGVNTILITEPLVLTVSTNWQDAVDRGALALNEDGDPMTFDAFFGRAALIDVFSPDARDWFWNFYRKHTLSGVAGWWGDLGEPETHPDDTVHATGRGEDLHNAFGHEWARMVYEGYRKDFPERRPFNLMRAGFVGTQRYGILPWSGDVSRSWAGLKPQIELSLQMGLQGVAYMHSDLGGFAGNTRDPELYTRWMQLGVFQPIFRPHGHEEVAPEPIYWDQKTKDRIRRAMELRYRLLPYNYTLMFENARMGWPLMRPLFYMDDRPELLNVTDTFLWGDSILVAPILEPGATNRTVTLPRASDWINFWTGERHDGGQTIEVSVTLDDIPVFVRAGAFIPMIDPIQNTREYDPNTVEIHYFHDNAVTTSTGLLYDDDGRTFGAYQNREYEQLVFRSRRSPDGELVLTVDGQRFDYDGGMAKRTVHFVIHGLDRKPGDVRIDDSEAHLTHHWDKDAARFAISAEWDGRPVTVSLLP